jgi:2-phosphosulfolactate phosphatase
MKLDVCYKPADFPDAAGLAGQTAVVIDVLRATSSIVTALAADCRRFLPVETIEEAEDRKGQIPDALLAGERRALPIPGFDLGNSPFEYTAAKVAGKTIIMTTTNGTVALRAARPAAAVYVASFVNASAVACRLADLGRDAVLLCAGTRGRFSLEDMLCAGFIADRLTALAELSDTAMAAAGAYRGFQNDAAASIARSSHGSYLVSCGFAADIEYCLTPDRFGLVPVYDGEFVTLPGCP